MFDNYFGKMFKYWLDIGAVFWAATIWIVEIKGFEVSKIIFIKT